MEEAGEAEAEGVEGEKVEAECDGKGGAFERTEARRQTEGDERKSSGEPGAAEDRGGQERDGPAVEDREVGQFAAAPNIEKLVGCDQKQERLLSLLDVLGRSVEEVEGGADEGKEGEDEERNRWRRLSRGG